MPFLMASRQPWQSDFNQNNHLLHLTRWQQKMIRDNSLYNASSMTVHRAKTVKKLALQHNRHFNSNYPAGWASHPRISTSPCTVTKPMGISGTVSVKALKKTRNTDPNQGNHLLTSFIIHTPLQLWRNRHCFLYATLVLPVSHTDYEEQSIQRGAE